MDYNGEGWRIVKQRKLGSLTVSEIGLGCMGMSAFYGTTDEGEALATIDRALELGCNFLDSAETYGPRLRGFSKPTEGFEPSTPALRERCSGQLSYVGARARV